jgi:hypothetical protein
MILICHGMQCYGIRSRKLSALYSMLDDSKNPSHPSVSKSAKADRSCDTAHLFAANA